MLDVDEIVVFPLFSSMDLCPFDMAPTTNSRLELSGTSQTPQLHLFLEQPNFVELVEIYFILSL